MVGWWKSTEGVKSSQRAAYLRYADDLPKPAAAAYGITRLPQKLQTLYVEDV